jgi:hypothetical protein
MKINFKKMHFLILFLCVFFVNKNSFYAQSVTVEQDGKFEQLLNEKRKINSSIKVYDRFKIQIYKGGDEDCKNTYLEFKKNNPTYDVTIVFSTPEYKVWVGNYKSRIEATRNLEILKQTYPKALLIKPSN